MTEVFTAETTIDGPVDTVWARLVDWDTAARWMSGVDELRAQGPTAAGTTLVFTTRGKQRTGQIVALDPGRSVTIRSIQGGVTAARQPRSWCGNRRLLQPMIMKGVGTR